MALTLKNLMHLRCMQGMKLIAGEGGLERPVCSAGIADYEFARNIHMNRELAFAADSSRRMIDGQLTEEQVTETVKGLSILFKEYSRGIYVSPKKDHPLELERLFHSYYLNKSLRQKAMLCRYEKGLFLLLTSSWNSKDAFALIEKEVLEGLGLSEENSVISRSWLHPSRSRLDRCLRESWQTYVAGMAMDCNYGSSFLLKYRMICVLYQRRYGSILRLCFFQKRSAGLGKSPTHSPAFRRIIRKEMRNIRSRPEKEDKNHEDKNF